MIASQSHDRGGGIARHHVAAALLLFAGLLVFAIMLVALFVRGMHISTQLAAEAAVVARFAPYVLALSVAHGLLAYFAAGASPIAIRVAIAFSTVAAITFAALAVAVLAGWRLLVVGSMPGSLDRVAVPAALALLYATVAILLRDPKRE